MAAMVLIAERMMERKRVTERVIILGMGMELVIIMAPQAAKTIQTAVITMVKVMMAQRRQTQQRILILSTVVMMARTLTLVVAMEATLRTLARTMRVTSLILAMVTKTVVQSQVARMTTVTIRLNLQQVKKTER